MKSLQNRSRELPPHGTERIVRAIRRRTKKLGSASVNNVFVNNIAILTGTETRLKRIQHPYVSFAPRDDKSLQENAGFSDRPEINEAVQRTHDDLHRVARLLPKNDAKNRVLDIGCGPGLYLQEFDPESFDVTGIDLNEGMRRLAQRQVPHARIIAGNFLDADMGGPFDLVYSIGVFIYIGRSEISGFFAKVRQLLSPGGLFFLNYQHALSLWDLVYPDLTYIQYSPHLVERVATRHLAVVEHHHAFDDRTIELYDRKPYKSLNPNTHRTFRNSSVIILRNRNPR